MLGHGLVDAPLPQAVVALLVADQGDVVVVVLLAALGEVAADGRVPERS